MTTTPSLDDRLFLAAVRSGPVDLIARRALRKAVHLLGLLLAHRLQELRSSDDPVMEAQGKIEEQATLLGLYSEMLELLGERWDKIPDRTRPHYTPGQRLRILRLKHLLDLSNEDTARIFRVSDGTISRWQADLDGHPFETTVGSTVRPSPPLRRYADVVAHTVQTMALLGFQGAQTLARAGWSIGKTTVSRYLRKPHTTPPPQPEPAPAKPRVLKAKYVNHIWIMDFTSVRSLFGLRQFTIAVVMDVFSRLPLAVQVFDKDPTAEQTVAVLEAAIREQGRPRHFVSDQGAQFRDQFFRAILDAHRIKQRYGAIGKHGSIALVERFIRTMKQSLGVSLWRPLLREDLERRLPFVLTHYCCHRPHSALGGATPAEVHFGLEPAHREARHPPRGSPGEGPRAMPFKIAYLDPEHRFPILQKRAA